MSREMAIQEILSTVSNYNSGQLSDFDLLYDISEIINKWTAG